MARKASGTKVFVDTKVIEIVDQSRPAGMSRTAWVNYLLQLGNIAVDKNGL